MFRQKPFFYNIGGENFTLDDIKHGMLRGNKRKPGYLQRVLSSTDPKINRVPNVSHFFADLAQYIMNDPRILFVCLDYPDFVENVSAITGNGKSDLNESLDSFVSDIINAKVQINVMNREINMPKVFQVYASEFGKDNTGVLEFIYRYLTEPEIDLNKCIEEAVIKRNIYISYQ